MQQEAGSWQQVDGAIRGTRMQGDQGSEGGGEAWGGCKAARNSEVGGFFTSWIFISCVHVRSTYPQSAGQRSKTPLGSSSTSPGSSLVQGGRARGRARRTRGTGGFPGRGSYCGCGKGCGESKVTRRGVQRETSEKPGKRGEGGRGAGKMVGCFSESLNYWLDWV